MYNINIKHCAYLQLVAISYVAVFAVKCLVPARLARAVGVRSALHGRTVESQRAEDWAGEVEGGGAVHLAHLYSERLDPLAGGRGTLIPELGLVGKLG